MNLISFLDLLGIFFLVAGSWNISNCMAAEVSIKGAVIALFFPRGAALSCLCIPAIFSGGPVCGFCS